MGTGKKGPEDMIKWDNIVQQVDETEMRSFAASMMANVLEPLCKHFAGDGANGGLTRTKAAVRAPARNGRQIIFFLKFMGLTPSLLSPLSPFLFPPSPRPPAPLLLKKKKNTGGLSTKRESGFYRDQWKLF